MPIAGYSHAFTKENVDLAPASPGVYELVQKEAVIYIGKSGTSIRSRLQRHLNGDEGSCTKAADHYRREVTTAARADTYEAELLAKYRAANGKLPRCNERLP